MTAEQITTIFSSLVVIGFLWIWVQALKKQISEMNKTIEVQQKTLEAMKTQVSETEKIGSIYRQFIEELPSEIEKYKTLLTELKEVQISQLKKANEHKDERLKGTAEIEIRLSTADQLVNYMPSHRPATWKWLSAFSTIEPNLLLIRSENDDTEEEPNNKAD